MHLLQIFTKSWFNGQSGNKLFNADYNGKYDVDHIYDDNDDVDNYVDDDDSDDEEDGDVIRWWR